LVNGARRHVQVGFIWSQACTEKFVWPLPDKGLKKHIHRIGAPTLIVWGKADGVIAPAGLCGRVRAAHRPRAGRDVGWRRAYAAFRAGAARGEASGRLF